MKTKHIIIDLLEYLEIYIDENGDKEGQLNTTDFLGFLNARFVPESIIRNKKSGGHDEFLQQTDPGQSAVTDVSILITLLFRYAKMYIKKALKTSKINTADEFSFLITLMTHEFMTKHELIKTQVMEKTSGIEILNRLIKQGFVEQYDDVEDKRRKLLKITPAGRNELMQILPVMNLVSQIVVGDLSKEEQNLLTYLLRKLDCFHNDIYLQKTENEMVLLLDNQHEKKPDAENNSTPAFLK
jgi:DNA-binding MarR family transcriptional regulator